MIKQIKSISPVEVWIVGTTKIILGKTGIWHPTTVLAYSTQYILVCIDDQTFGQIGQTMVEQLIMYSSLHRL